MSSYYKVVKFYPEKSSIVYSADRVSEIRQHSAKFSMPEEWTGGGEVFRNAVEGLQAECLENQQIKVVVLTRHGSASQEKNLIDVMLTQEGVAEAEQAAKEAEDNESWLPREMPIFTSCLTRSYQTAKIIRGSGSSKIVIVPAFHEQLLEERDKRRPKSALFDDFEGADWSLAQGMTEIDLYENSLPVSHFEGASDQGLRTEPADWVLERSKQGLSDAFSFSKDGTFLRIIGHGNCFNQGIIKALKGEQGKIPWDQYKEHIYFGSHDEDEDETIDEPLRVLNRAETVVFTVKIEKTDEPISTFKDSF